MRLTALLCYGGVPYGGYDRWSELIRAFPACDPVDAPCRWSPETRGFSSMSSSPAATRAWPQTAVSLPHPIAVPAASSILLAESWSFSQSFSFLHAKNSILPIPTLRNREEITLPSRCTVKLGARTASPCFREGWREPCVYTVSLTSRCCCPVQDRCKGPAMGRGAESFTFPVPPTPQEGFSESKHEALTRLGAMSLSTLSGELT